MSELRILLEVAIRNLFSNAVTLVIGAILFTGTFLMTVGGSILTSVDSALNRSVTGTIGGDLQISSAESQIPFELFRADPDTDSLIAAIPDFSRIKSAVSSVENVKAIVPMGLEQAEVVYGNPVDRALETLRKALRVRIQSGATVASPEERTALERVRQMLAVLQRDFGNVTAVSSDTAMDAQTREALTSVNSDRFWSAFGQSPLDHLEFLENKVAPILPQRDPISIQVLGTDLDSYRASFDRVRIVDGEWVPSGHRGLLLSKYVYERKFKIRAAYGLDRIKEALDGGRTIAADPDLRHLAAQVRLQARELVVQMDPTEGASVTASLKGLLGSNGQDLESLLDEFLTLNDVNLRARYEFFYRTLAPHLDLYLVRPGDMLTLTAIGKNGFSHSVSLKVYGTVEFAGLEKSEFGGAVSFSDLISFRDLYGAVTPEALAESQRLREAAGAKVIDRGDAEATLFSAQALSTEPGPPLGSGTDQWRFEATKRSENFVDRVFAPGEVESGVVLSAAVILKNPSLADAAENSVRGIVNRNSLGLRVAQSRGVAGVVGQFIAMVKSILYVGTAVVLIVTLLIISNVTTMMMLQRVREIGTLRAIGAQRGFILRMIIVETGVIGLVFGLLGVLCGAAAVLCLGTAGIPARYDILSFCFSGPRLFPLLSGSVVIGVLGTVLVVSSSSALYPAFVATRVSPLEAMQSDEGS